MDVNIRSRVNDEKTNDYVNAKVAQKKFHLVFFLGDISLEEWKSTKWKTTITL